MTDLEKLRATSYESLLACLRDRLVDHATILEAACDVGEKQEWIASQLRRDAERIDLKLRMERGE